MSIRSHNGRSVLVHCRAEVSRSAMVTAAYLMARDGLSRHDALTRLGAKRSRVGPQRPRSTSGSAT